MFLDKEHSMKRLGKLIVAATALTLLAGTAVAAQVEPSDKDLAKVRSDLAATQKALTEARQALEKSQADQAAAQAGAPPDERQHGRLRDRVAAPTEQAQRGVRHQ